VGIAASITVVLSVLAAAFYFGSIAEEFSESSHLSNTTGSYHTLWDSSGIPIGYGLIAFTFSGHALVPSIYSSMERPQDFEKMTTLSFMICVTCCITIAVSGYYTFGSAVDDQITVSLEKASGGGNSAISAVTWLMILTAFSKYTLSCFPIALGLEGKSIMLPLFCGCSIIPNIISFINNYYGQNYLCLACVQRK